MTPGGGVEQAKLYEMHKTFRSNLITRVSALLSREKGLIDGLRRRGELKVKAQGLGSFM
jgi:hypothetical protein